MSKKVKEPMTVEQIYQSNKRKARVFKILTPIVLYLLLGATLLFFCLTMKNSIGNVMEILEKLDKEKFTGAELAQNYTELVAKWGEWEIIGNGASGLLIRYVNVGNALFSGLMVTFATLMMVSLCLALILGKIVFPSLAKHYSNNNDEMVDMATLKSAAQIDKISASRKEWF
jgi:hypothetical protein